MTAAVVAALAAAAAAGAPEAGPALSFRVCALVEARATVWPAIGPDARIDPARLSFRSRVFLAPSADMPSSSRAVRRALAAALRPVPAGQRARTAAVLKAIGAWVATALVESDDGGCPPVWRSAARVLADGRGNGFELVRTMAALARAAGIPARPAFDGRPMVMVYVTGRGPGAWTVWHPGPAESPEPARPVLWMPLRERELPPLRLTRSDAADACRVRLAGRPFGTRDEAEAAFGTLQRTGDLPAADGAAASATVWWEVWSIGGDFAVAPPATTAVVTLPYVPARGLRTLRQAVWASDPLSVRGVSRPQSSTDQELGGFTYTVEVRLGPADAKPAADAGSRPGA